MHDDNYAANVECCDTYQTVNTSTIVTLSVVSSTFFEWH